MDLVKISLKEYEGMKETIKILQDPDMISQLIESHANIKQGKIKEFIL